MFVPSLRVRDQNRPVNDRFRGFFYHELMDLASNAGGRNGLGLSRIGPVAVEDLRVIHWLTG
jgi:hypothetical protein